MAKTKTALAAEPDISAAEFPAPPYQATGADISAVKGRLHDAGMALLALHHLAYEAQDVSNSEWYLNAIKELARSTFKGIDACIERLGAPGIGNFRTEFDD